MAITLEANYSKKIGLPQFSSHQFSLTLKAEVTDLNQVGQESARLYSLLQNSVDQELQHPGYVPGQVPVKPAKGNGNGHGNGHHRSVRPAEEPWKCSEKQKELILKITDEHKLDKNSVEQLAQDRFSKGVKELNKLEASGLIEALLEQTGQSNGRRKVGGR